MGTIVNAAAIIIGSLVGLGLKKGIKVNLQTSLNYALGLAILIVGLNGILTNMLSYDGTSISSNNEMILLLSLVIGVCVGEFLNIDEHLNSLAQKLEKRFKLSAFSKGFINASLIFCVGAMAIIGSINDGLLGNPDVLYLKSGLDGVTSLLLSASLGVGVLFSFIPVLIYQGLLTIFASSLEGVLTGSLLSQICMVGYVLVLSIGLNFMNITKIKVANFLPALLLPLILQFIF